MTTLDHDELAFTTLASSLDLHDMADGASLASTAIRSGTRIRRRRTTVGWSLTTVAGLATVLVVSGVADSAPHAASPGPSSRPAVQGHSHRQAVHRRDDGGQVVHVYAFQHGRWVQLRVLHP